MLKQLDNIDEINMGNIMGMAKVRYGTSSVIIIIEHFVVSKMLFDYYIIE